MICCTGCLMEKAASEFYVSCATKCKDCIRAAVKAHRAANIERYRERERQRVRDWTRTTATTRAWRERYPERRRAHVKAIRTHTEPPPICERCHLPKRLERHHPDYDQPKLIQWLCKPCHAQADKERRAQEVGA